MTLSDISARPAARKPPLQRLGTHAARRQRRRSAGGNNVASLTGLAS
jgi:hypothetical protein